MDSSRAKNSIRNIIFGLVNQVLTILLGFINRSVFIWTLGVSYLGISGLFSDILMMLSLADLGFGVALTYSMYKPLAEHDYDRLAALTGLYRRVYRVIALVVTVIGIALVPFLKYLINLRHPIPHITLYYLMFLANTVASYLVVYKTSILTADQKDYLLKKYQSIFSIGQAICTTTFLWLTRNYFIYLLIQVIFTYAQNFYASWVAERQYPFIKRQVTMPLGEVKEIFRNLYSVFIYKVSGVLLNATDNTIISVMIGTGMVGYYSNYSLITTQLTALINTIFYSLTASLGNLVIKERAKRRYQVFKAIQSVSDVFSSICTACLFLLAQDLIRVWLGQHFLLNNLTLLAIVVNFYLGIILLPIWVYREATGLYQQTKYVMVVTAIINLVLSIWLAKTLGVAGVLFASAIARLATYFWYEPVLLFKKYFGTSSCSYFTSILKNILVTVLVVCVCHVLFVHFVVSGWLSLFIKAFGIGIVSLTVTVIFYSRSQGIKSIWQRIRKRN